MPREELIENQAEVKVNTALKSGAVTSNNIITDLTANVKEFYESNKTVVMIGGIAVILYFASTGGYVPGIKKKIL